MPHVAAAVRSPSPTPNDDSGYRSRVASRLTASDRELLSRVTGEDFNDPNRQTISILADTIASDRAHGVLKASEPVGESYLMAMLEGQKKNMGPTGAQSFIDDLGRALDYVRHNPRGRVDAEA